MSKQLGIAIAVIVLLAVGALAYMQFGGKSTKPTDNSTKTQENNQDSGSVTGTIKSLLTSGKNVTCSVKNFGGKEDGQGVVYVSGKNIRGDFSVSNNGKKEFTHIIQNDGTSYFWGDALEQGIKMKVDLEAEIDKMPKSQTSAIDLQAKLDFTCVPWTVDDSIFTPPSDVKFQDMTATMNSMKAQTTGTPNGSGYSCAGISDAAAKAACENSMKQYSQ